MKSRLQAELKVFSELCTLASCIFKVQSERTES